MINVLKPSEPLLSKYCVPPLAKHMLISSELAYECNDSGMYDGLTSEMVDMGTAALATAEYDKDFHQFIEQWSGNYRYKDIDGAEFMTNIFGEIAPVSAGSIVAAKGNHYAG